MHKKGSKKRIDDALIAENNAKRAQLDITDKLKEEGGIREAAAVFSHEGFAFMLNVMGDIIVDKMEPVIEKMIVQMLQGMGDGMQSAYRQIAAGSTTVDKKSLEIKVQQKLEEMLQQKEVLDKADEAIELAKEVDDLMVDQIDEKIITEKPAKKKKKGKNLALDNKVFHETYTGVKIPRYPGGNIMWKELTDDDILKIAYHYAYYADEKGMFKTISTFINSHQEARAVYQQLCSRQRIKWKEFMKNYRELYPEK